MPLDNNEFFSSHLFGARGPRGNPGPAPQPPTKLHKTFPDCDYYIYERLPNRFAYRAVRMGFLDYEDTIIGVTTFMNDCIPLNKMYSLSEIRKYDSNPFPVAVNHKEVTYKPKAEKGEQDLFERFDTFMMFLIISSVGLFLGFASVIVGSSVQGYADWKQDLIDGPPHQTYQEAIERREEEIYRREAADKYLRSIEIER